MVLRADPIATGWRFSGGQRWCSGAHELDGALVTARANGGIHLFMVECTNVDIRAVPGTWPAEGVADSDSGEVVFDDVTLGTGNAIGGPGSYTDRSGILVRQRRRGGRLAWGRGRLAPTSARDRAHQARGVPPRSSGSADSELSAAEAAGYPDPITG
jgi:alkylation response protein AidB-like acyl-CoA dehydrogenase